MQDHPQNTTLHNSNITPNVPIEQPPPSPHRKPEGIFGFLKQLLPRDFDTTDLLIVLIILLMAGDCEEQRNNALLTLALYFFM